MVSKISTGFIAGAVVLALGAGVAYAALAGDEAITARQTCMKASGKAMGDIGAAKAFTFWLCRHGSGNAVEIAAALRF